MNLNESDITVNGINLHLYRTGTDKRPLLFAHGLTDNGLCFWPLAQQFAGEYEIILYDSRNHGQSEAPDDQTTLIDRADDLAGLIAALGLHKPALIGHSLGAVTVAVFAGLYPDVPGCIVLEDPPPFEVLAADDDQSASGRQEWRADAALNKQKSVEELVEMNREAHPDWPEAEREPWARAKQQVHLNAFDERYVGSEQGYEIISQISCPTLIVTADQSLGAIFPVQTAEALAASMPNAQHAHIADAGHSIHRGQPGAFYTALRDFLEAC